MSRPANIASTAAPALTAPWGPVCSVTSSQLHSHSHRSLQYILQFMSQFPGRREIVRNIQLSLHRHHYSHKTHCLHFGLCRNLSWLCEFTVVVPGCRPVVWRTARGPARLSAAVRPPPYCSQLVFVTLTVHTGQNILL